MGKIRRIANRHALEDEASNWIARLEADDVCAEDRGGAVCFAGRLEHYQRCCIAGVCTPEFESRCVLLYHRTRAPWP